MFRAGIVATVMRGIHGEGLLVDIDQPFVLIFFVVSSL